LENTLIFLECPSSVSHGTSTSKRSIGRGFSLLERRILYFIATIGRTGSGITNSDTDNWW
jgi:hypothetical protein